MREGLGGGIDVGYWHALTSTLTGSTMGTCTQGCHWRGSSTSAASELILCLQIILQAGACLRDVLELELVICQPHCVGAKQTARSHRHPAASRALESCCWPHEAC